MKKLFLLAFVLIGFITNSNAQRVKFGVKGGANLSTVTGGSLSNNVDARTGFHIGVIGQVGVGKFAVQPEIIYSAQGTDSFDTDYLNFPILVKYKFLKFLSFDAGPQFGILVNDNYPDAIETKSFDISAALGAGVEFGKFFAQLRYNIGLTEITENSGSKNGTFQISAGYYIF